MLKRLLLLMSMAMLCFYLHAQVTTGNITGTVKDNTGHPLTGATITATHTPTGSIYRSVSGKNGTFDIPNLRVGGPYQVTVTYVGFGTQTFDNLTVTLGTPLNLEATLESSNKTLNEVTVTAAGRGGVISSQRTGTSTNVSQRQLTELPTITRNIQDFARFTPQASSNTSSSDGSPLGINFAGQSTRYNQFTIDGANANDVFGLASSGTNGGQAGANPIPLDAVQEVQIVLSPYDVTQGGFTGGGINAVTKSGTNNFHGSAYYYLQNQDLVGKSVTTGLKYQNFSKKIYGASLGGALIKNKLFFFLDVEKSDNSTPLAYDPSEAGSGSKFDVTTLGNLRQYVISKYGFDPGGYTAINKSISSTSVFARLDWNISDRTKLTIRHSYVDGSNYVISRSPTNITFANSGYSMLNTTNSTVLELNSNLSSSTSNVFRVTYNNIRDKRQTPAFPSINLTDGSLIYNLGADFSSPRNSLAQDNFTLVDNYTIHRSNHIITIGTNNEFYNTKNVFLQYYYGYYTYKTSGTTDAITAFENNTAPPTTYNVGYSTKGGNDNAAAKINAAQFGVYAQDVWSATDRFKLTYGLRVDMPAFFNNPDANSKFNSSWFASYYDVQNNQPPRTSLMFSPRVGFNWDVKGNRQTQVRGGAGLFTGRVPFVWVSNQYTNTGVASIKYSANSPSGVTFNYNPSDPHLGAYIPSTAGGAPTEVDVTAHNFKFPQVFRTNLAIDQKLPWWGLIGTIEGIYTKTLNNINYKDINLPNPVGSVTLGNSSRPWWNFQRGDNTFSNLILLTNTSRGYSYNFTAQLQKPYTKGWTGMIAYTLGHSYSLNDGTSSTAYSNWRFSYNINGLNYLDLARSNYDLGSRVIGYVTKEFRYAHNRLATNIGLVYNGQSGLPFSYVYSANVNGDDVSGKTGNADLAYVPATVTESQFVPFTKNGASISAAQQWTDFQNFLANNKYLAGHIGQNTGRNGDRMPWESHFDLRVAQEFFVYKMHRLEVSIDILNVANLLNKDWGWSYYLSNQEVNLFTVVSQKQVPTFNFDITKLNLIHGIYRPWTVNDYNSRWRGQFSVRYSF